MGEPEKHLTFKGRSEVDSTWSSDVKSGSCSATIDDLAALLAAEFFLDLVCENIHKLTP